ncbi:MAG: 50S ribosomal protein L20 [Candidatus Hydrogenedentota bacterium]
MVRVKGSPSKRKRKKLFQQVKGFYAGKSKLYKTAREAMRRALRYAWRDRRRRKRDFRRLWIIRINAECRENDIIYSKFMYGLKLAGVQIDRQMLSEMAISDKEAFKRLVEIAKDKINADKTGD